jgi:hypothetical protein
MFPGNLVINMKKILLLVSTTLITFSSCWLVPVNYNDRKVVPYLQAIASVKHLRDSLGFTAISHNARITIEGSSENYDAMLHVYQSISSRTIAFKRNGDKYLWIGEQEIFTGPKKFNTADGIFNETITFNYDKQLISGYPIDTLSIQYAGPDPALCPPNELSISKAKNIIGHWEKRKR